MAFKNALSWFEIPVSDLERAQKFYEMIFGAENTINSTTKEI